MHPVGHLAEFLCNGNKIQKFLNPLKAQMQQKPDLSIPWQNAPSKTEKPTQRLPARNKINYLFTAAWWAVPPPLEGCWSFPQTPAWRADCPPPESDALSLPVAIWIWATWTCDKNKSHGGEEDRV